MWYFFYYTSTDMSAIYQPLERDFQAKQNHYTKPLDQ